MIHKSQFLLCHQLLCLIAAQTPSLPAYHHPPRQINIPLFLCIYHTILQSVWLADPASLQLNPPPSWAQITGNSLTQSLIPVVISQNSCNWHLNPFAHPLTHDIWPLHHLPFIQMARTCFLHLFNNLCPCDFYPTILALLLPKDSSMSMYVVLLCVFSTLHTLSYFAFVM